MVVINEKLKMSTGAHAAIRILTLLIGINTNNEHTIRCRNSPNCNLYFV